jgi:hypothetical protein
MVVVASKDTLHKSHVRPGAGMLQLRLLACNKAESLVPISLSFSSTFFFFLVCARGTKGRRRLPWGFLNV